MLRSTHRPVSADLASQALPTGWTQHKAPTGHTYYYNAKTKKSTYTRPVDEPDELQIDYDAKKPDQEVQASMQLMQDFYRQNTQIQPEPLHFTGGKSYQDRSHRARQNDRPRSKKPIKDCGPWILVMTKFKRRFVHNLETKESLWKFPSEVMMAVIEMEKDEWQAKQKVEVKDIETNQVTDAISKPSNPNGGQAHQQEEDSEEYEEVEVTDDEDETAPAKRPRIEDDDESVPQGPVDFDEDDIAWQLEQMEEEDLNEDNFDENGFDVEEEGLPMTSADLKALFRSLLDEARVNPYSPFDTLLEDSNLHIIEDERWIALSNMGARRKAFADWSRDRIAELQAREAIEAKASRKQTPHMQYLTFLQQHATPKLYWPEFKRKFKKQPELKSYDLTDKEREKIYREYVAKLKGNESDRKKDFVALLKSTPKSEQWNRSTSVSSLPDSILNDLRFYLIRDTKSRDGLVEAHLTTLKR